jgi:gas vesicle protein
MEKVAEFITGIIIGGAITFIVGMLSLTHEYGRLADHKHCQKTIQHISDVSYRTSN